MQERRGDRAIKAFLCTYRLKDAHKYKKFYSFELIYNNEWKWCENKRLVFVPWQGGLSHALRCTLQPCPLALSILVCRPVFSHPLGKCLLQGVKRQRLLPRTSLPHRGLSLVLKAMVSNPYETLKHSFLQAFVAQDCHADYFDLKQEDGWADPCCMSLWGDHSDARLKLNPSFLPRNLRLYFGSRFIGSNALWLTPHADFFSGCVSG